MKKILISLFYSTAILGSLILLFAGITEGDASVLGQGISYLFFMFVIYLVVKLEISVRLPLSLLLSFVIIGWFFAMLDEVIFYSSTTLYEGGSLAGDLLLTTPVYLLVHLIWFHLNRRYIFTWTQALLLGGFAMLIGEELWTGIIIFSDASDLILLPALPSLIFLHGFHMMMPPYLMRDELKKLKRKKSIWKYFWGVTLLPLAMFLGRFLTELGKPWMLHK